MRHLAFSALLSGALSVLAVAVAAFEIENHIVVGPEDAPRRLQVISTADADLFAPLLQVFADRQGDLRIDYTVASSTELMRAVTGGAPFDVALSSAMDLQTKLANDGHTRPHRSAATALVPARARWREHLFAFSQEPAALVISPAAFQGLEVPRTRLDLIRLLRDHEDRFRGRVGTYDVAQSGLGYLFATQDVRASESYWRLTEVMGSLETRLYCCSGDMIEDVSTGRIALAYNVLGSYAAARTDLGDRIEIVEFQDYTTLMLRTAAILRDARNPDAAAAFVDHLIRAAWGAGEMEEYPFPRLPEQGEAVSAALRPIRLGPGLLVHLDALKRQGFLSEWRDAMRR